MHDTLDRHLQWHPLIDTVTLLIKLAHFSSLFPPINPCIPHAVLPYLLQHTLKHTQINLEVELASIIIVIIFEV